MKKDNEYLIKRKIRKIIETAFSIITGNLEMLLKQPLLVVF